MSSWFTVQTALTWAAPVSYTHLDVYKRQNVVRTRRARREVRHGQLVAPRYLNRSGRARSGRNDAHIRGAVSAAGVFGDGPETDETDVSRAETLNRRLQWHLAVGRDRSSCR